MAQALPTTGKQASEVTAANCIELSLVAESCKWFPALAKFLSPKKPAATIHFLTAEPERTCYEWVRGKFDPPSRVLVKLLHSEIGWRVLEFLMRDCKQAWWHEVLRAKSCAAAFDDASKQISFEFKAG